MKIHNNIEQGSDEWHALRSGRMTASHAQEIGNNGKGLQTYIYTIMAEKYSMQPREQYNNAHMQRGTELEPIARSTYELLHEVDVETVGFIEHDKYTGCSPDGLIGEDGGIEIKCHDDLQHFKLIVNGEKEIPSKYIWQMQMNMLITGRTWWEYVAFNPNYTQPLLVFRVEADEKKHTKLLEGIAAGKKIIKEIEKKYKK